MLCRLFFCFAPPLKSAHLFSLQDKVYQFCSKVCCEDYKKLHCIVTFCEYCQEEKTLHETVKFSGVKRPFCSEGWNPFCRCAEGCSACLAVVLFSQRQLFRKTFLLSLLRV